MISIWYADGADAPAVHPSDVLAAAGLDRSTDVRITLGWTIDRPAWLDEVDHPVHTHMAGYGLARDIAAGRITTSATRLGRVPTLIEEDRPDIAVVGGVRRGDDLAFVRTVGWGDVLARTATSVVVELHDDAVDVGAPPIAGDVVATVPRPASAGDGQVTSRVADDTDLRIGALVAALVPDGASLQFGPGGIGEGIVRSLERPVSIWSGLITDQVAELHDRGLLEGPARGAYLWGGEPLDRLADAGRLDLRSVSEIHDVGRLASIPRMVACNTAVQVGLDGSVNVERAGDRLIAGIGGHADFSEGASKSPGGLSVIAVRSTTPKGSSTIVSDVTTVSTARSDVDVVVTEHGIADLRGADDAERARRLTDIAAPEHRAGLAGASG